MKSIGIALTTFTLILATQNAKAVDVFGTDNSFIKVTQNASKTKAKFEFCSFITQECELIGKGYYSKTVLASLRDSEKWDVGTSTVADVLIVVGSAYSGGALGSVVYGSTAAGSIWGTLGLAVSGGLVGLTPALTTSNFNPYEQYKQLETLEANVYNDDKVMLDYKTAKFAERLGTVLSNLK